jgi:hypothetical protein
LRYGTDPQSQIWDYSGYNQGTQALLNTGTTAQPLFHSYNVEHVNDIIGVWNQVGESRTISSSFNLAGVYSDLYSYSDFLGIILDTLDVYRPIPVSNQDDTAVPNPLSVTVAPNPFGNNLSITAKSYTKVRLGIYNIKGQLIQTAVVVPANGKIQWNWNNKDTNNRQLPSGIYLLRLDNGLRKTVIKTLKLN